MSFQLELLPPHVDLETKAILKKATLAHRYLVEFKGVSQTIPNQSILINTHSSAIENTGFNFFSCTSASTGRFSSVSHDQVIQEDSI